MPPYEIHINRRGIHSIDVPTGVEVTAGSDLVLLLINHGSPLHVTLASANSGAFTDFFHENLYIADREEFRIPIRENAYPGSFDVGVITGYGMRRAQFAVAVAQAPEEAPASAPLQTIAPLLTLRERLPVPAMILGTVSLILYVLWLLSGFNPLNYAAFVALLLGVVALWFWQRS